MANFETYRLDSRVVTELNARNNVELCEVVQATFDDLCLLHPEWWVYFLGKDVLSTYPILNVTRSIFYPFPRGSLLVDLYIGAVLIPAPVISNVVLEVHGVNCPKVPDKPVVLKREVRDITLSPYLREERARQTQAHEAHRRRRLQLIQQVTQPSFHQFLMLMRNLRDGR